MEIYIDGQQVELYANTTVNGSIYTTPLSKEENCAISASKPFAIPITGRNRRVMGDVEGVNCVERFNAEDHFVRVEQQGCIIIKGLVVLKGVESMEGGEGSYRCLIVKQEKQWVERAKECLLHQTEVDFECVADGATVAQSWTWDRPVRFLPVARENFEVANVNSNLFPPTKVLCFEDYHPFLHLGTVVRSIFAQSGYGVDSKFLKTPFFESLYMSGNYQSQNVSTLKSKMDFVGGRFTDVEALADRLGRVYADPNTTYNTIGNIVDTANPFDQRGGVSVGGAFSNGGCIAVKNNRLEFKPTQEVSIAFEFDLKYRSDYVILNRTELTCFNRIYFAENDLRKFQVANRFEDKRTNFEANRTYLAVIFNHTAGANYQFKYDRIINPLADPSNLQPGDVATYTLSTFSTRTIAIPIAAGQKAVNPRMTKLSATGKYVEYSEDWALYDGYVAEKGGVDIELTIRTKPSTISPGSPKHFDMIYFGGANQAMKLSLYKESTIRPIFMPAAGEGTTLSFKDVAFHSISQDKLIEGIKQLFNLSFYTDNEKKIVYIEPQQEFTAGNGVIDWSEKMDQSRPVLIEELGVEFSRTVSLQYKGGDAQTTIYNQRNGTKLGRWSMRSGNRRAKGGEISNVNPIFTTATSEKGKFPDAPSASLVVVGDSNGSRDSDLNFAPRIVSYLGMKPLDVGEIWGWPTSGKSYPHIAFHDPQNNTSLCFEDRDGVAGLHRFYDHGIETQESGLRITLYMYLSPVDVEQIATFRGDEPDMRSMFRLKINGETLLARLEQVVDYSPNKESSTKCIFIKKPTH